MIAFDTLKYADRLKKAKMEPRLAEELSSATADVIDSLITHQLATKQDLKDEVRKLEIDLKQFIVSAMIKAVTITSTIIGILNMILHIWK